MEREDPLIIAGAGIAGLTAAINLALTGRRVIVFERRREVGMRHHGDHQAIENWTSREDALDFLKRINIDTSFPFHPFYRLMLYDRRLRPFEVRSERPGLYMVRRGPEPDTLDSHLKRQALLLGVELRLGEAISPESARIIATGPPAPDLMARGLTFRTDLPPSIHAIMDESLVPKGYAYLLTLRGRGTLAVAGRGEMKNKAGRLLEAVSRFEQILNFNLEEPKPFCGVAAIYSEKRRVGLPVGEAAGLQDGMWGFGMRLAFLSGYLAARSIIEASSYRALIRRKAVPHAKSAVVNRFIFEGLGSFGQWWLLRRVSSSPDSRAFLQRLYKPYALKCALYPLAWRKVRGFRRPRKVAPLRGDLQWQR